MTEPQRCEAVPVVDSFANISAYERDLRWSSYVPTYSLFLFVEKMEDFEPVLLIPGHGGGHVQLGYFAQRLKEAGLTRNINFDVYAVNHNNEYSGIHGASTIRQSLFMTDCINYILSRYNGRAKHVVLVGHSMGGVISSSVFLNALHTPGSVKSIITMGSPHYSSAASFDWNLEKFYHGIQQLWRDSSPLLEGVVMRTILFGAHDKIISSELGFLESDHVIRQWTGYTSSMWCYPRHNPFTSCKNAVGIGVRAVLEQFSPETGLLLSADQRRTGKDISAELLECKSLGSHETTIQPKRDVAEMLHGRFFEISTATNGNFHVELTSTANLLECLKVETLPRADFSAEVLPLNGTSMAWSLRISSKAKSLKVVRIDARSCHGSFGYLYVSKAALTRRPLWSTLRFYRTSSVTFPASQHLHRRVEVKVPTSDVYYKIHFSCVSTQLVVRVKNSQNGETVWFNGQRTMIVRMHRNPLIRNAFRTDKVDIWMSPECGEESVTIAFSISLLATAGLWMRRYCWWIIGIGFVAALAGLFESRPLKFWQPDVFLIFFSILCVKHFAGEKFLPTVVWEYLLLSGDPGMIPTIIVFAFFWIAVISVFNLVQWPLSYFNFFAESKKRSRGSFQSVIYPAAILTPIPYALLFAFLGMSVVMLTRPENSCVARGYLKLLAMVNATNVILLGVWPKNLMNGSWSVIDHAPWLTLPIAICADLLAYGRINYSAMGRYPARIVRWTMTGLVLAWSRRMLFMMTYGLAVIAIIMIIDYTNTRPPRADRVERL
ncbi:hypothetical protein PSACC_01239 [Paramicrosporidium saccamoebae]|uniref:GPI inositol-deacylase n=1 Tax=Paramicrosporidium saccamoebae TaxID=1246581 RepID=A0A2H9TMK3_9FUNG|nr:hypothetical protein PSACC_01239 [Paramicrosporidium saccamoebae]